MSYAEDRVLVAKLLGREPQGAFEVIKRRQDNSPVVIQNFPLLDSGRPMPTLYWLTDLHLIASIGRVESDGGVDRAESEVNDAALLETHIVYARKRDKLINADYLGPRPYGGVGGTRQGVKCLHAHYANYLVDGKDPVGLWVQKVLEDAGEDFDPKQPGKDVSNL